MSSPMQFWIYLLFLHTCCWLPTPSLSTKEGCTAPLILPDRPFFVVWNHPSERCELKGMHLGFEKWGIVDNPKDKFKGDEITLFYDLGKWPRYAGTTPVFGGIPQLGNLEDHLAKARQDVENAIPNKNFTGLSVIDFESWRPLYGMNFDRLKIYQQKSYLLAKQRHPEMNHTQLLPEAKKEFGDAARLFLEETLKEVSAVRPFGKWGYYGYPRCWGSTCKDATIALNNQIGWVFRHSTGLYPSIYFQWNSKPAYRSDFIKKRLKETLRVKARFSKQDTVILPYANIQNGPYRLFTEFDLTYAIGLPADLGASGVVLWGSSSSMAAKNECLILQNYINSTLGPYVKNVTDFFSNCSQENCAGHGRCVRKDYEAFYQQHLRERGATDCLIPEENLKRKRKGDLLTSKAKKEPAKDHNTNLFSHVYHKLKNTLFGTLGEENRFTRNGGHGQPNFVGDQESLTDHPKHDHSARFGTHGQSVVNFEIPESDESLDSSENEEPEPYQLTYDFDDYACKCFAGWAGTHCRQKQDSDDDDNA